MVVAFVPLGCRGRFWLPMCLTSVVRMLNTWRLSVVNHAGGNLAEGVVYAMRPFGWWLVEMEEVREAKSDS